MTATATTVTLPDTPAEVLAAMRAGRRATALGDLARRQLAFGFDDTGADAQPTSKRPTTTQIVLHAHLSADA
ncbi:MAG: hypothetical protein JWN68_3472, partial [Nocardioides sp.]|uniref:hypothetical protein n=1 Tax=Nocardioides sp. TaxID=35761 RepID=UPI0026356454